MPITFEGLEIGKEYDRNELAERWGYKSFHPLSRGVVTPSGEKELILFVTKDKQSVLTQYNDYIDSNLLFWEGESGHRSDQRIAMAENNHDQIHLFYRDVHHTPFVYYGEITLLEFQNNINKPSEFIFRIKALSDDPDIFQDISQHNLEYQMLDKTEQEAIIKSRVGQGSFRDQLIRLWGGCSITGAQSLSLLQASHIKPWRNSNNTERLDRYNGLLLTPNFDILFDKGMISFQDSGHIIISNKFPRNDQSIFQIQESIALRKVYNENRKFLEYHRDEIFR